MKMMIMILLQVSHEQAGDYSCHAIMMMMITIMMILIIIMIMQVSREQAGNYSCHASNVEGDAESDPVTLTIMCKSSSSTSSSPACHPGAVITPAVCHPYHPHDHQRHQHPQYHYQTYLCATMTSLGCTGFRKTKPSPSVAPSKATLPR